MFLVKNSRPTDRHGSRSYTCPFLLWSDRFCAESRRCGNIQAARNIHTGFNEQGYHLGLILEPKDLSKKWGCTEQRMQVERQVQISASSGSPHYYLPGERLKGPLGPGHTLTDHLAQLPWRQSWISCDCPLGLSRYRCLRRMTRRHVVD